VTQTPGFSTRSIHGGLSPDPSTGAILTDLGSSPGFRASGLTGDDNRLYAIELVNSSLGEAPLLWWYDLGTGASQQVELQLEAGLPKDWLGYLTGGLFVDDEGVLWGGVSLSLSDRGLGGLFSIDVASGAVGPFVALGRSTSGEPGFGQGLAVGPDCG
jgi:hypothetical protein